MTYIRHNISWNHQEGCDLISGLNVFIPLPLKKIEDKPLHYVSEEQYEGKYFQRMRLDLVQ